MKKPPVHSINILNELEAEYPRFFFPLTHFIIILIIFSQKKENRSFHIVELLCRPNNILPFSCNTKQKTGLSTGLQFRMEQVMRIELT